MKNVMVIGLIVSVIGCKVDQPAGDAETTPAANPMIQTAGCTISKNKGNVTITCADGSSSTFAPVVSSFYVRDGNNTDHMNLRVIDTGNILHFLNSDTGNIVTYNSDGSLFGPSLIYFEAANCAGNMWAPAVFDVFANAVYPNLSGAPGLTGFTVSSKSAGHTALSSYTNGICTNGTTNGGTAEWVKLTAVTFDSVPQSLTTPLTVVSQ